MKTTYRAFTEAYRLCSELQKDPNQPEKFRYACGRFVAKNKSAAMAHDEKLMDLRVDHAATDDSGFFLKEEDGSYRYTKEGFKKLNEAARKLAAEEVQIEPYLSSDQPKELPEIQLEILAGFVIDTIKTT